jgi:hypothetical protein
MALQITTRTSVHSRGHQGDEGFQGEDIMQAGGDKDAETRFGVAESTRYGWKSKCGGMDVGEAQRLRSLEGENCRLKAAGSRSPPGQRSADANRAKKRLEVAGLRADAAFAIEQFAMSERQA